MNCKLCRSKKITIVFFKQSVLRKCVVVLVMVTLRVQIPAPNARCIIFTLICCNNVFIFEKTIDERKRGWDWPFLKVFLKGSLKLHEHPVWHFLSNSEKMATATWRWRRGGLVRSVATTDAKRPGWMRAQCSTNSNGRSGSGGSSNARIASRIGENPVQEVSLRRNLLGPTFFRRFRSSNRPTGEKMNHRAL